MLSEEGKKVKKQLEELNQTKRMIRNLQSELEYWKQLGGAITSASLEPRVEGGTNSPYAERRMIKIDELENMISDSIDKALNLEDIFLQDCSQLDTLSQNLLFERYLTGKPLKKIIREFNYCESHIYRLYDSAFEKVSKNKKDESK